MTEIQNIPKVELYSDGWANPNPGPGGYGIILCCQWVQKEFTQWYTLTTNNRMELSGVITWLSKLTKKSNVHVYTDSQYTINGIQKGWAKKWKANNWMRTKNDKAVNADLWEKLLDVVEKHQVTFHWVKGHNWHEQNERCDELATLAMKQENLIKDEWFIPSEKDLDKLNNPVKIPENTEKILKVIGKWDPNMKVKKEGDPCKKCLTPVEKKIPKHTKKTLLKKFYYRYYFNCPNCKTNYMTDEAKDDVKNLKL